jgi:di/tricarboxylate transporter
LETGKGFTYLKLLVVFVVAMVISAFLNNTPVVVMFIPIVAALAAQSDKPTSTVMMPLSFLCVLGGMTTLIGSSTNLLVANAYAKLSPGSIGFFDFTIPGLALAVTGFLFVVIISPLLLPSKETESDETRRDGRQFIAQIELAPGHPLVGARAVAGMFPDIPNTTVRIIQRGNSVLLPPFDDLTLRTFDSVIVAATRKILTEFLSSNPEYLYGMVGPEFATNANSRPESISMCEAVVAPGSRMAGRTLAQIGFNYQTNCVILAVQRRSRMIRSRLSEVRLESGDVLLIAGRGDDITALRSNRDIIFLEWSAIELPTISHANRARLIFSGVILTAASGVVPIVIAAVAGAALMIWTGCLNIRQATRGVDQRIFLLIGTSLALGLALEATGGASYLATTLVKSLSGSSIPIYMSAFFLFVAALTNVLSNNATAVLMTPIAVSTAFQLNVDPLIFVYTVIFAANCSFVTPISYQTNLLVMGPGQYEFKDFMRVGTPLLIVIWLTYTFFAPWYFGISW